MSLGNIEVHEGTLDGSQLITLARPSKKIVLTNDSGSTDLKFRTSATGTDITLLPTESLSVELSVKSITLTTLSPVPYRLWIFG